MQISLAMNELLTIAPYQWSSIGASIFCGAIVGLERQLRGKPVGIRTSSLIVLGTYIFMASALSVSNDLTDYSRIIGQIVTGVGFLGAGVMLAKDGVVVGVTSAAAIWVLAAIGVSISVASSVDGIKLALVVVAILYGVDLLEDYSATLSRGVHAKYSHWKGKNRRIETGEEVDR